MNKIFILLAFFLSSCSAYQEVITFPPSNDVFITSGDGNIQKPYTPMAEFVYTNNGWRLPLPILGLIPFKKLDPEMVLRKQVSTRIKEMGGDGMINMRIAFMKDNPGVLGFLAKPGYLYITGTVIKR